MDDTDVVRALHDLESRGDATLARRVLKAHLHGGLPATADGLYRLFRGVWQRSARPVARRDRDYLLIPAGPWGPEARVHFGQRWVRWGAITCHRHIFLSGPTVSASLLAHEYRHTVQAEDAGGFLPYLRLWSYLTARYGYMANQLEQEAFAAGRDLERQLAEYGTSDEQAYGPRDTWHPPYGKQAPARLAYRGVEYPALRPLRERDRQVRRAGDAHLGVTVLPAPDLRAQGDRPKGQVPVGAGPGQGDRDQHPARVEPRPERIVGDHWDWARGAIDDWGDRLRGRPADVDRATGNGDGRVEDSTDPRQTDLGLIQQGAGDAEVPF